MTEPSPVFFKLSEWLTAEGWPIAAILPANLNGVWVRAPSYDPETDTSSFEILLDIPLALHIPGLDFLTVTISPAAGGTSFNFALSMTPFRVSMHAPIVLSVDANVLRPLREGSNEPDTAAMTLDIPLGSIAFSLDGEGHLDFGLRGTAIRVPRCMVGTSGVLLSVGALQWLTPASTGLPPNTPANFTGLFFDDVTVEIPQLPRAIGAVRMDDVFIGTGGFSGRISQPALGLTWDPAAKRFAGAMQGELFGFKGGISALAIEFRQNALVSVEIAGDVYLPYLEKRIGLTLGMDGRGGLTAAARTPHSTPAEPGVRPGSAGSLLHLDVAGLLAIDLEAVRFVKPEAGPALFEIGGRIAITAAGINSPPIALRALRIDTDGNVRVEGGWLDLRDQFSVNLHGFRMDLTRLGFGQAEEGGKWIGFSGALRLADGVRAGASVEGLRITWYEGQPERTALTLNGVGVEFEVPNVLRFQGAISYEAARQRFTGNITLHLISLNLRANAVLVFGTEDSPQGPYTYMGIYLGVDLPAGIPLWSTGLALYGMAGLFALHMEPDKHADEEWYNIGETNSYFHRPTVGVTDLVRKWTNSQDSLALGAGVTVGTLADNGYTFSGRLLLAIVFPGPIIMIEGRASLLAQRSRLDEEPNFRALAVLDNRAGTFLIGLDAQYKYDREGRLINVRGGAEAFFNFSDASAWHVYVGEKEPREKRIRARLFSLFDASAYVMLDAQQLALGARIGYEGRWSFGPLSATLEAWIEGNAMVSWSPAHFHGDLALHAKFELRIFGIGLTLGADASIAADVFDPFHVLVHLSLEIRLFFPIPTLRPEITLEWGPIPDPPPLPLPLKEIAVEHFKVTTSWPLPRDGAQPLLLPNYDAGDGLLVEHAPAFDATAEAPANVPTVPLDCRPHITFSRAVSDDARIGINSQPADPEWERIGDPTRHEGPALVRYALREVALEKWVAGAPGGWTTVAQAPERPSVPKLYGSWAPVPAMPDGGGESVAQTKLWLWSKTPFDYTRHAERAWDEWFTDRFADYPCVRIPADREVCCDFQAVNPGQRLQTPWRCPDQPRLVISWTGSDVRAVTALSQPIAGLINALCFVEATAEVRPEVMITLPQPAREVRLVIADDQGVEARGFDARGNVYGPFHGGSYSNPHLRVVGRDLVRVILRGYSRTCLLRVCAVVGTDASEVATREDMMQHLRDEMARWEQAGEVLEPHTTYRLKVVTAVQARGEAELAGWSRDATQTEYAYFRTDGPPGLADLSTPIGHSDPPIYNTGTISVTNGSAVITGTSTHWNDNLVGATLQIVGENATYPILRVDAVNRLTLGRNFSGSTRSELTYAISRFDSGLDDLTRYVRQTIPATVPGEGEKPLLPRPVYRAYDVGVEFNENYVDLMYQLERRDLGLYLYDNNNQPVRDAQGRLIVLGNRWGRTEELTLTESERRWIRVVNASTCATLDARRVERSRTLSSAPDGQVLDADTVYEARLTPLLLHEDFRSYAVGAAMTGPAGSVGGWRVQDEGAFGGSSRWEVGEDLPSRSRFIIQTTDIWGGTLDGTDPVKPGTMLLRGDPDWTDYRLSVYLRSTTDDDAIGVVFRYRDANHYYRFSMDRERRYRRLVRVAGGTHAVLAEDDFVYRRDQDYLISVEAVGPSLRVYQDGTPVFDVTDPSHDRGQIGFYCWGNIGARFSDVRVDDFRQQAPVVYRFKFTTSRFANFFHHIHSFQDETWLATPTTAELSDATFSRLAASAVATDSPPSEEEARAYEGLAAAVLKEAARQTTQEVEVTRVDRNGEAVAFLVRSPEPIDWKRTSLEVRRAGRWSPPPEVPRGVKLTNVTFGSVQPNEESVTLLLREPTDLTSHRIEVRQLPGPIIEPDGDPVLLVDEFAGPAAAATESGIALWRPSFTDLGEVEIVNEAGVIEGPPHWMTAGGELIQSSNIYVPDGGPHYPGTYALGGSPAWGDVEVSANLRSNDNGAIGVMFRYQDTNNYYRFSMDSRAGYRRLVKKVSGRVSVLWEDTERYTTGQTYSLGLRAVGSELRGTLDGMTIFTVRDNDLLHGRTGFYSWANKGARFAAITVVDRTRRVGQWMLRDEGTDSAPSVWRIAGGALLQTSDIGGGAAPAYPGTYVLAGDRAWSDYRLTVQLHADDDDAVGVIVRYVDDDNYYRLSLDAERTYRRLTKKERGVVTTLWEDAGGYRVGEPFTLTVDAIGPRLVGYLGDARLFEVIDNAHAAGQVGLYCWANTGARFERVEVRRPPLEAYAWLRDRLSLGDLRDWRIVNEGSVGGPSDWRIIDGTLRQTSSIHTPPDDRGTLSKLGTQIVAGNSAWTDTVFSARLQSSEGAIGVLFRYGDANNYYRFSMDRERGYRRLVKNVGGTFTLLWEDGVAYEVGRNYELTVAAVGSTLRGYLDGIPMFVVEDGDLGAGQVGLYCWKNTSAQFFQVRVYPASVMFNDWLLDEPFDVLIPSRWTFEDEGDQGIPSRWEVSGGDLRQTSKIYGGNIDPSVPDKPGTNALSGDLSWTDYRVTVRLRADAADGSLGVMFRHRDANNYYRFSMDKGHRYRRLIKKVSGAVSVLWEDHVEYALGREYVLTLDCMGSRLDGYVDGVRIFSLEDNDLTAGRIGLYCWAHKGARFAEVLVAAPVWTPYYVFGREVRLPAGTRVRVHAGSSTADLPPQEHGVIQRFIASVDERGQLRLSAESTDLRVRGRGETSGHTRRFLHDSAYVADDVLVLRKADGTGFFLFKPRAARFEIGQHRLIMNYRRDNRAADASSQILREAGNSAPEHVMIDIPWQV